MGLHRGAWSGTELRGAAWGCTGCIGLRRTAWGCMGLHGLHGGTQKCVGLHGAAWCCTELHGGTQNCMGLHGAAQSCTELHGVAWGCTELHGIARGCTELHGVQSRGSRCAAGTTPGSAGGPCPPSPAPHTHEGETGDAQGDAQEAVEHSSNRCSPPEHRDQPAWGGHSQPQVPRLLPRL